MVEQLADLGVKIGRTMEIKLNEKATEKEEGVKIMQPAFSACFWDGFNMNHDGTFGGDTNVFGAKFRAEPFRFLELEDRRKLLPICLN